ncbi:hypothetical protein MYCTH_65475 [Thermothelomyces thermophilus ATCC 42464]|uniref:Conidiation-specific protein 6 n=1 Tax=Thermothelomyces thermophilus (strain ATCC 42464 / BCRC 31852 / DSM 1799) TaxID=573729 RepID=G2Q9Y4_THET4|nr:uncharacterized protein MYCTH_65475 [Thermothelomyces thermophilus ATCC 42464]AEO56588.1 hypothetical protein MYCTH_65475 [Thermothelomyces thermophilus ATCC 42464]
MADSRNRERGLRAALNNPRVSEEAKQHDRELLESEFGEHIEPSSTGPPSHPHAAPAHHEGGPPSSTGTDKGHPASGRKPRRASIGEPGGGDTGGDTSGLQQMVDDKERGNVIRGLKAALKNPHVSEKAKEADREKLRALGETVE